MIKRTLIGLTCLMLTSHVWADCTFDIEVGDSLAFSTTSMEVDSSCESVTVNLTHTGTFPVEAMGHNWVLSKDSDFQGIATDGMGAGVEANYLPADDTRIIASTKLIGGGESDSITFSIAELDASGAYTFFCSFPGHWSVMKGSFTIS